MNFNSEKPAWRESHAGSVMGDLNFMESIKMKRCTLKERGFIGYYYSGNIQKEKAVIAVGGTSCDEKISVALAQHLIDAGYNVLVLGFYLWKGLSKNLASIPVDYCEKAVE